MKYFSESLFQGKQEKEPGPTTKFAGRLAVLEVFNILKTSANRSSHLSQIPGTQLCLHWISNDSDPGALFDCLGGFTHAMVYPSLVLLGQYIFQGHAR